MRRRIPIRPHIVRRPRGNRAKVTDKRLADLYVKRKLNVAETALLLGVSTEYVSKRLHEAALTERRGTFTPDGPWDPDDLRDQAFNLYGGSMTMKAVGQELGVSVGTVRVALHQAGFQVRRGGFTSHTDEGRTLLDDLYRDPKIVKVLARHGVVVPEEWSPTGPFESLASLPLPPGLPTELYEGVGLPVLHMSPLLGVGQGAVRSGLKAAGVALRQRTRTHRGRHGVAPAEGPGIRRTPRRPGNTRGRGWDLQPWGNRTLNNLRFSPQWSLSIAPWPTVHRELCAAFRGTRITARRRAAFRRPVLSSERYQCGKAL